MESTRTGRDVVLPASTLVHLRRAFQQGVGRPGAVRALHAAGWAAGEAVSSALGRTLRSDDPAGLDQPAFWAGLDRLFRQWGWGRIEHERVHPGLALLVARDWMESDPSGTDQQPGCGFTSGLLARVLGSVSPGPLAVLEVGCRSSGDHACRFLVGSEAAVFRLYELLLDGRSLEGALAAV